MCATKADFTEQLFNQALDEILSWCAKNSPDVNPLDVIDGMLTNTPGRELYETFPSYMKLVISELSNACKDLMQEADDFKNLFDFINGRGEVIVCTTSVLEGRVLHDLKATLIKRREQN